MSSGQSAEIRKSRRHGRSDLPERCGRLAQSKAALLRQAHLRKCDRNRILLINFFSFFFLFSLHQKWSPSEILHQFAIPNKIRKPSHLQNNQEKTFKKDQLQQVNPPKYEKCEDMSNLTYLNDASVLWNLKARYINQLIYVSALACLL